MRRSASSAIQRLYADLSDVADPERANAQKAYLKSDRTHLGMSVGTARKITRAWVRSEGIMAHDQVWNVVLPLWASNVYESKFAAVEVLSFRREALRVEDLVLIHEMLASAKTWALVDPLSIDVVGNIVTNFPAETWGATLDTWSSDESFWVRRASLLCEIRLLRDPDHDAVRFFRYADSMISEKEFFIRKAIGWVLRDMSKTRQTTVYDWVLPRATALSGVTVREAVKYLTQEQHNLIAVRRQGTG